MNQHIMSFLSACPVRAKAPLGPPHSKTIGYDFIDTDLVIQRQAGMTLGVYLASRGYHALRQLEAEVICALDHAGTVITGGVRFIVKRPCNTLGRTDAWSTYECELDVLNQRIASMDERGIAAPSGQTLADVQAERIPLYEQFAEITVEVDSENTDSTLGKIIQHLGIFEHRAANDTYFKMSPRWLTVPPTG